MCLTKSPFLLPFPLWLNAISFLQYLVILGKHMILFKRVKAWCVLNWTWEESGFGREKGKVRDSWEKRDCYTVASMSCPFILQIWIFPLWHCSWPRHQSQTPLVITLNSWNQVSDISEGKCSRKRTEEIILKHCLIHADLPQCHLLSCCSSALQDMTQQF